MFEISIIISFRNITTVLLHFMMKYWVLKRYFMKYCIECMFFLFFLPGESMGNFVHTAFKAYCGVLLGPV